MCPSSVQRGGHGAGPSSLQAPRLGRGKVTWGAGRGPGRGWPRRPPGGHGTEGSRAVNTAHSVAHTQEQTQQTNINNPHFIQNLHVSRPISLKLHLRNQTFRKRALLLSGWTRARQDYVAGRSQVTHAERTRPGGPGRNRGRRALTLYPVTSDSFSAARTRSQRSSTFVSVAFQTTLPGGWLGAGRGSERLVRGRAKGHPPGVDTPENKVGQGADSRTPLALSFHEVARGPGNVRRTRVAQGCGGWRGPGCRGPSAPDAHSCPRPPAQKKTHAEATYASSWWWR